MKRWIVTLSVLACTAWAGESLVVASLNPLAADLARQVGGERVRVVELMRVGQDPHAFRPSPSDMRAAAEARLFLAMGKGLETFLSDLAGSLEEGQTIVEIGRLVPSLRIRRDQGLFVCCPTHGGDGAIDPHWWHSIPRMKKAAVLLADAFAGADSAGASFYRDRAKGYGRELDELHRWVHDQLRVVPRANRKLATAHAAFNYFCEEYGFEAVAVNGLSSLDEPRPVELAAVIATIRRQRIAAVFPEATTSSKVLEAMVRETGVALGETLLPGTPPPEDPTYSAMVRHNVTAIVTALAPTGETP